MTLKEYIDKFGDRTIENILTSIDELPIPDNFRKHFKDIVEDNEFDILEHNYISDYSDYADRMYEEHKEKDL